MKTCTFTGHRALTDLNFDLLDRVIKNLMLGGCNRFLCGMAKGFDLAAAESVVALGKECGAKLVACVPCGEQSAGYTSADKKRYERILSACSEIVTLSENYYAGCMQVRDRFMVDNADVVVAYLRRRYGGTYYTVRYAQKCGKKIIEV